MKPEKPEELTEWDFDIPKNNRFEPWPLELIMPTCEPTERIESRIC